MSSLPPFASASDLIERGMTLTGAELSVADALLVDASEHIRSLIGRVWPQGQSTINLWASPGMQWLPVPLVPLISIDSVMVTRIVGVGEPASAVPAQVIEFDGKIRICGPAKVTVTCTHGFADVPAEIVSWTCVLVAEALGSMRELGTLSPGSVASVAIDDYRKAYQPQQAGGQSGPFSLPVRVVEQLRAQYGGGAYVSGSAP